MDSIREATRDELRSEASLGHLPDYTEKAKSGTNLADRALTVDARVDTAADALKTFNFTGPSLHQSWKAAIAETFPEDGGRFVPEEANDDFDSGSTLPSYTKSKTASAGGQLLGWGQGVRSKAALGGVAPLSRSGPESSSGFFVSTKSVKPRASSAPVAGSELHYEASGEEEVPREVKLRQRRHSRERSTSFSFSRLESTDSELRPSPRPSSAKLRTRQRALSVEPPEPKEPNLLKNDFLAPRFNDTSVLSPPPPFVEFSKDAPAVIVEEVEPEAIAVQTVFAAPKRFFGFDGEAGDKVQGFLDSLEDQGSLNRREVCYIHRRLADRFGNENQKVSVDGNRLTIKIRENGQQKWKEYAKAFTTKKEMSISAKFKIGFAPGLKYTTFTFDIIK